MNKKRTSGELKRIARDLLNDRYVLPMGAFVIVSILSAIIEIPFSHSATETVTDTQYVISILAEFLILIISRVLSTGIIWLHIHMTRGEEYHLNQLLYPFQNRSERFFGAAFLLTLGLVVCMVPAIAGAVYLNIFGVHVLPVIILVIGCIFSLLLAFYFALNYHFVLLFILEYPEIKVLEAFQSCRLMMYGNRLRLFYILFSFLGWACLIVLSFGIAALWISPYMTETLVVFYMDCTGELDRIPVRNYQKKEEQQKPFLDMFS